ncbi:MAG: hypothetical protein K8S13_22065, partial [Desulfobacula sp.]|uniref:CARDB domain-containing protein n=1 Tax=Desulfobacula sp. TaxID=2593537 RepID=UPI0025B8CC3A
GEGGTLKVIAISSDGLTQSEEYLVNFKVTPPPPFFDFIPGGYYVAVPLLEDLEYQILGISGIEFNLATWEPTNIDSSFPLFGGKEMKIGLKLEDTGPFSSKLSGKVNSKGKAELFAIGWDNKTKETIREGIKCTEGIKLPYTEIAPNVSFEYNYLWSEEIDDWMPGGSLELGCDVKYSTMQIPLGALWLIPIYLRAEVELNMAVDLSLEDWTLDGPSYSGNLAFDPLAKGILGAGIAKKACVEGYLGGGFHSSVQFYPEVEWQDSYAILLGGLVATFGPFKAGPVELSYEWPNEVTTKSSFDKLFNDSDFTLLSRDYMITNTSKGIVSKGSIIAELPIKETVFPYSVPDVAPIDNDLLTVWVDDNTSRNLINRTQLMSSIFSSGAWLTSVAVDDDGTADMNPQIVSLPGGDAAVIYQNAKLAMDESTDFETFNSNVEIAVSSFDSTSDAWSTSVMLTDNAILDHSPNISAASASDMLGVWISNADNDYFGSSTSTNTIMYSQFDGSSWSFPTAVTTGIGTILGTTLAYNGTTGTFIYVVDSDDDLDTVEDQELWFITFGSGIWAAPQQLTNDLETDANPILVYDSLGDLHLAWLKGSDIRLASGLDVTNAIVFTSPGQSQGVRDFDVSMSSTGNIALVWNDVSETYNDIWMAYYDAGMDSVSTPRRLTFDDAAERFISTTFDVDENLICVYDKNFTQYEDRTVTINGQEVTIQGVPESGASNLTYLSYFMDVDLSVDVEGVNVDPPMAIPGSDVTIAALIKNVGETPVTDTEVDFYQCDDQDNCTLISTVTIPETITGGGEQEVTVPWAIPIETDQASYIRVDVDPSLVFDDQDRSNNSVTIPATRPDTTVSSIEVQNAGNNRLIT